MNLSYMGLGEDAINMFAPAIRRSKSLLGLHFSGNPGNTESVRQFLEKRIHCKKYEEPFNLNFNAMVHQPKKQEEKAIE
jgi:hypothetical protein